MVKGKKILVKVHPQFEQARARDAESGVMFTKDDAVEIGEDIWKRLEGKEWTSNDGQTKSLLVEADSSEFSVEDNEAEDAPWEADIEDSVEDGSVLQDTNVEEEE